MNYPALILAIAMIETGNDPKAIGAKGEVTQLQISQIMIDEYNQTFRKGKAPVTRAHLIENPKDVEPIFVMLCEEFVDKPTVYKVAYFWRLGRGFKSKEKSKSVRDYAERASHLYAVYLEGIEGEQ